MIIENAEYRKDCFDVSDLYIFAVGYEHRSYYLYDQLKSVLGRLEPIIFAFDDYHNFEHTRDRVEKFEKDGIHVNKQSYFEYQAVQEVIVNAIKAEITSKDSITVHIDYSSMPRSWYCQLPILLESIIRDVDKIYFWYAEGEYPSSYEEYPSAGIDAFSFFSGKPSLQIENNRIHVLALGYDAIRTQAIVSITDPDYLALCYAYNPDREGFSESIQQVNHDILARAAISLSLRLNDFSFMVAKLRETANELLSTGDVILIPDGPKPLIFAISLIPDLLNKNGLSCLHVARNSSHFEAIDVIPTGVLYGFSMQID